MKLYIQVENNQPINHPALESNLLQVFNSIPNNWEPFVRVDRSTLSVGVYEVLESDQPTYEKVNGIWTDVWSFRNMTAEEKTALQQFVINMFNDEHQGYLENFSTWTLDEETCTMQPPIPRLNLDYTKIEQRIYTFWCGADNNWKDTPVMPEGNYKFDFFMWQWIEVTE